MLLLMLFAILAGAGTAITPCVLPVLPALLSASAAGGRRRPLGIVLGLAITFTIAIVALAQLVKGVGLASSAARYVAYAAGLSAVLLLYALGGRAVIGRIRQVARGHLVEQVLGVVLLLTGVAMATNIDIRFEEALARSTSLPAFLTNPTRSLENSSAV